MNRSKKIIQTSIVSIAVNLVLVVFKLIVGAISGSIAIILDAVNNLGDALSSIITIAGTKLAGKAPDKKHPYGYGRIEYISSIAIAAVILSAGFTSAKESADKIIHPEAANYTLVTLLIIVVGIITKFLCGNYVKNVGKKINAQSLVASGSDAFFDAILSIGTLIAAGISMIWHISLEGYLGLVISIIIIKASLELLLETLNSIIGTRADADLTKELKARISKFDHVNGAYDLVLHNYGPMDSIGSVHIEVDDSMTAPEIHSLSYHIIEAIYAEYGIMLTVGIYASNITDKKMLEVRRPIEKVMKGYPEILSMHGFYADLNAKKATVDFVIDFKVDKEAVKEKIRKDLKKVLPEYDFYIVMDTYYSD